MLEWTGLPADLCLKAESPHSTKKSHWVFVPQSLLRSNLFLGVQKQLTFPTLQDPDFIDFISFYFFFFLHISCLILSGACLFFVPYLID